MSGGITRRAALAGGLAALAGAAAAHTPYRQWVVYRKTHLMIGAHRGDAAGYARAKAVAEHLAERLPASRARVARAPAASRLAGLLATGQLDIAVLDALTAQAMAVGADVFLAYGALELATLAMLPGGRVLAAHARFPERHGAQLAEALLGSDLAPLSEQPARPPLPWRAEALARLPG